MKDKEQKADRRQICKEVPTGCPSTVSGTKVKFSTDCGPQDKHTTGKQHKANRTHPTKGKQHTGRQKADLCRPTGCQSTVSVIKAKSVSSLAQNLAFEASTQQANSNRQTEGIPQKADRRQTCARGPLAAHQCSP